ncbi:hypothetical protein PTKIN_Ptkin16aG0043200 [Pterospermum kingtungense]
MEWCAANDYHPKHGISEMQQQDAQGSVKVARMKAPDTSTALVDMNLGLKQCEEKCLSNCSCLAYASAYYESKQGNIGCLTWHGDLVDARTFPDAGQDLYIRVDADELGMRPTFSCLFAASIYFN